MIEKILPSFRRENITDLDLDFFIGSNLIIFDIDNTLVFVETTETKKKVIDWFNKVSGTYKCVCCSNSRTISERKEKIENLLGCHIFLSKYKKPSKRLFNEIIAEYNLNLNNKIFVVGDKVFPDVLFGNFSGAKTVLVGRLTDKETVLIKIQRIFEKCLLSFLAFLGYNV